MAKKPQPHEGEVDLRLAFDVVYERLKRAGVLGCFTSRGKTPFDAVAAETRDGRKTIRFSRDGEERARAYGCCWGSYHNCNRTRIGMYCAALTEQLLRTTD